MNDRCLCESPNEVLSNTHYRNKNTKLSVIDKGIVIFEDGIAIATFDIKYCPVCGVELKRLV